MRRLLLLALLACDTKGTTSTGTPGATPAPSTGTSVKDKVVNAGKKVDKALDGLDADEANTHLANAKDAVGKGSDPAEDCSWVRGATSTDATADAIKQLQALCATDVPLAKATKAVVAAETAKQEQPGAPSYTECSSDSWAKAKTQLASSTDSRWTYLQTRWKKVCPDVP